MRKSFSYTEGPSENVYGGDCAADAASGSAVTATSSVANGFEADDRKGDSV